jgi:hypothetical protein
VGDIDLSPPSSAQIKDKWSYTTTPSIHFHGEDTDDLHCTNHNTFNEKI